MSKAGVGTTFRQRVAEARMRHDKKLVAFGSYAAEAAGRNPIRCESCDSFGHADGAGVARFDTRTVRVMCRGCAGERNVQFLPLPEAHAIAQRRSPKTRDAITAL